MKANFAIAIVIVLYAQMGLATSAESQNGTSVLGEPSVEELAIKLLQATCPDSPELNGVQLLPGKLPQDMPVDLPIPDGARIVEARSRRTQESMWSLDVPMTPDLALDFYRKRLASQNWTEIEIPSMNQGFVGGDPRTAFCQGPKNLSLSIIAHPQENRTDLRLSIISDPDYSLCSWDAGYNDDWLKPIPKLAAPKETRQSYLTTQSGYGNIGVVSAIQETTMNSSSLTAHYADQLTAANWTMMGEGESGPSSWSSWSYNDKEWPVLARFLDGPGAS